MKKNLLLMLILPFALFLITTFYWIKAKDSLNFSYNIVTQIHQLQLIDPKIDKLILAKTDHINYDEIVLHVNFFSERLNTLKKDMSNREKNLFKLSKELFKSVEEEFKTKEILVEEFKSKYAVLQNSLRFVVGIHKSEKNSVTIHNNRDIEILFNSFISNLALLSNWSDLNSENTQQLLINLKKRIKETGNHNIFIYMRIHIQKIIELSKDIYRIKSELHRESVQNNLYILKAMLIKEFSKNRDTQDRIFYMLIIFLAIFLLFLILFIVREKELEEKLRELNAQLNSRIRMAVQENREKDKLMFQQSKLASMGEMIGNIAHQWRQPLNSISIIIQDYESAYEFGEIDIEYLEKNRVDSMEQINYMSKTIDDFRNFFSNREKKESFKLQSAVDNSVGIIGASLSNSGIELILQLDADGDINSGIKSQYMQVVINILKNAQDILIEKKIANPKIVVKTYTEHNKYIVSIRDNAGGVPKRVKDKIFEPYFTTKHQSSGTGIGLYMSKIIIENNFGGQLSVINESGGANFKIGTPI